MVIGALDESCLIRDNSSETSNVTTRRDNSRQVRGFISPLRFLETDSRTIIPWIESYAGVIIVKPFDLLAPLGAWKRTFPQIGSRDLFFPAEFFRTLLHGLREILRNLQAEYEELLNLNFLLRARKLVKPRVCKTLLANAITIDVCACFLTS